MAGLPAPRADPADLEMVPSTSSEDRREVLAIGRSLARRHCRRSYLP